jgi:large subunit ribosomal protein L9
MEVLLTKEVDTLGKSGDVVVVSDGYARNYLLPRSLAVVVTPENMKMIESLKRKREEDEKKRLEGLKELAARIAAHSCTITAKAGVDDALYGSVSALEIAAALAADGYELDKKQIEIAEPIKALGLYTVAVKLHPEIACNLKVWVIKEK